MNRLQVDPASRLDEAMLVEQRAARTVNLAELLVEVSEPGLEM
jgi:hypothetical protein